MRKENEGPERCHDPVGQGQQAMLDLHRIMLEAMRSREGEILRYWGFLLSAIGGFLAVGWVEDRLSSEIAEVVLPAMAVVSIVILFFGAWYALALSYNYRYLQIITYYLQKKLGLDRFQPDFPPRVYKWCKTELLFGKRVSPLWFNIAPEIHRVHVSLFTFLMLWLAVAFSVLACRLQYSGLAYLLVWVFALAALGAAFWLGHWWYPKKHNENANSAHQRYSAPSEPSGGADRPVEGK